VVLFAGQGDPRRAMALLWRTTGPARPAPVRPGPKPALTVDDIVAAAIELADADGMAALSMRTVGDRLGRTAMALYTYVPSKAELLDLMYDHVLSELPTDYPLDDGWRGALAAWAADLRACYLRHPWVLGISQARPTLGPHEFALRETLATILRATGLAPPALRAVLGALLHFVHGVARVTAEVRQAAAATGSSDEEWWYARSGALAEVAPDLAERYPSALWIESERAMPADDELPYLEQEAAENFSTGLGVLLDGIAARAQRPAS